MNADSKRRMILIVDRNRVLKAAEFYVRIRKPERHKIISGSTGTENYKIIMEESEPLDKLLQASLAERYREPAVVITSQKELEIGSEGLADILESILEEEGTRKKIEHHIKSIIGFL